MTEKELEMLEKAYEEAKKKDEIDRKKLETGEDVTWFEAACWSLYHKAFRKIGDAFIIMNWEGVPIKLDHSEFKIACFEEYGNARDWKPLKGKEWQPIIRQFPKNF